MGTTKRPRKAYRPRPAYAVSPELYLRPMPEAERERLMLVFRSAVHAMAACQHPGEAEWRDLSDAINTVETLVLMRELDQTDAMPAVNAAIAAMVSAANRFKAGQGMRLDGQGLDAIRTVLGIYEACCEGLTGAKMAQAGKLTAQRIQQELARRRNDATVVAV